MKWTERESRHVCFGKTIYIEVYSLDTARIRWKNHIEPYKEDFQDIAACIFENQYQISKYSRENEKVISDHLCYQIIRKLNNLNCRFKLKTTNLSHTHLEANLPCTHLEGMYNSTNVNQISERIAKSLLKLGPIAFMGVNISFSGQILIHYTRV